MLLTADVHCLDKEMKLSEIAEALGGELDGDGDIEIVGIAHPAEAESAEFLVLAMDPELAELLANSKARAAVITAEIEVPDGAVDATIIVGRARVAMGTLTGLFEKPLYRENGIHPNAIVDPSATLGDGVSIGPFVCIGPDAVIGEDCHISANVTIGAGAVLGNGGSIHPGVRIGERVRIGDRFILHHNASIGSDGFSFVTPEAGSVEETKGHVSATKVEAQNLAISRINSLGSVRIGGHVEIGAGSTIDRGTVSDTRIGGHTKISNLVQIGHNVIIGTHCMICGQVGIAGSAVIGDRVVLAGQVGVKDHVTIGSDVVVGGGSGVGTDIPGKTVVIGYPAIPKDQMAEQYLNVRRLSSVYKDIRKLKARLKALETDTEKG
ncbi:MAG TPA: UDP-3-O-(3-hydroxymyristoyl)glucosamine N-acyltransferase [Rhodospirillaceae bacterium]|nr:UDP-3-O-(3-hydroxymyristoyl)glucosamine N-acyltransferase [Rhodospirillaceae bacterium]